MERKNRDKSLGDGSGLEWLDYEARMYDNQIGRFNGIDVLSDKHNSWSPFAYCLDNPIIFVDPDGKDVKPLKAFLETAYGTIFQDLRKNNSAFGNAIGNYENNKNFNLTLGIDNAKVKDAGVGSVTETPVDKSNVLTSTNTASYFLSSTTVPGNSDYKFTELGTVLVVAHEAVHVQIGLTTKNDDAAHNTYNTERQTLVNILTEYSTDNKLNVSTETITALAFSGQQNSKGFKSYINGLAKENGTTYKRRKASTTS